MRTLFTLALLAVATIASAQPGHGRKHGKGHYKHNKHYNKHHDRDDYRRGERVYRDYDRGRRNYDYRVAREMNRYDFLRLSRHQRSRLQVSLNFLVTNGYRDRAYEQYLRRDLYDILSRDQYRMWENRAYRGGGNTFVFNFGG